jgi:hypothetical protein
MFRVEPKANTTGGAACCMCIFQFKRDSNTPAWFLELQGTHASKYLRTADVHFTPSVSNLLQVPYVVEVQVFALWNNE